MSSAGKSLEDVAGAGAGEAEEDEGGVEAERGSVPFVLEESWAARREEISSRMLGLPDAGFRAEALPSTCVREGSASLLVRGSAFSSALLVVPSTLSSMFRPSSGQIS